MTSKPKILLRQPSEDAIASFLQGVTGAPFSYHEHGASNAAAPPGYDLDHNSVCLGSGRAVFDRARQALERWEMFPPSWSRVVHDGGPPAVDQTVAVRFRVLGLWWLLAARIVYVLDDEQPVRRYGFAYGTLTSHVERGEERFMVEWRADDSAWYDLRAFSQPRLWAARLAKPIARALQRRFVRDSQAAMRAAVGQAGRVT